MGALDDMPRIRYRTANLSEVDRLVRGHLDTVIKETRAAYEESLRYIRNSRRQATAINVRNAQRTARKLNQILELVNSIGLLNPESEHEEIR